MEIKKKPIRTKAIEAKAIFVVIWCDATYSCIIQTPNAVPAISEIIPGIPRKTRGRSSTTSFTIYIIIPKP